MFLVSPTGPSELRCFRTLGVLELVYLCSCVCVVVFMFVCLCSCTCVLVFVFVYLRSCVCVRMIVFLYLCSYACVRNVFKGERVSVLLHTGFVLFFSSIYCYIYTLRLFLV